MTGAAVPATTETFQLAEGPVWDTARHRLLWVDIPAGTVFEGALRDGGIGIDRRHRFDGTVGAVTVAEDGTLLVAAQEKLIFVGLDGSRTDGPRVVSEGQGRRLNDGKPDPAGRFLVGTMSLRVLSVREELVRLEADGTVTTLDADLTLSNGLAWSTDGTLMYSADTNRRIVFVRDYDPATGDTGERRTHVRLDNGFPDGVALDAADHLWVAVWGGGEVRRYSPDGDLVDSIAVQAPHTSSVAFAGDDLRTLVITTAKEELKPEDLRAFPDSGRLFTARVDVPGAPVPPWAGLR
jgi:sugar lactone lactonase YvrE